MPAKGNMLPMVPRLRLLLLPLTVAMPMISAMIVARSPTMALLPSRSQLSHSSTGRNALPTAPWQMRSLHNGRRCPAPVANAQRFDVSDLRFWEDLGAEVGLSLEAPDQARELKGARAAVHDGHDILRTNPAPSPFAAGATHSSANLLTAEERMASRMEAVAFAPQERMRDRMDVAASVLREGMPPSPDVDGTATARERMVREGYFELTNWASEKADKQGDIELLAKMVGLIARKNLPPQFLLLYAPVWQVVNALCKSLEPLYGLQNIHDFFVFNVRPGAKGWALHRDRAGADTKLGFHEGGEYDGCPKYTTVWLALTDASPKTSCIYVLPAHADPEYRATNSAGAQHGASASGPDATATQKASDNAMTNEVDADLVMAYNHQYVRALPVEAGTALCWSHRLIHWGSASPMHAPECRRTLTFAMADPSYEKPLLRLHDADAVPTFEARLALVAYTLISYHHSSPLPSPLLSQLLAVLASSDYAQHLTDAALSPPHPRAIATSFQRNLLTICNESPWLGATVELIANYVGNVRDLPVNKGLEKLAQKRAAHLVQ